MYQKELIVGLVCLLWANGNAYKIILIPIQQKSHISSMMSIAKELGERGHEVQVMINKEYKSITHTTSNVRLINFSSYEAPGGKNFEELTASFARSVFDRAATMQATLNLIREFSRTDCAHLVSDTEETLDQLSKEGGFDLALVDITMMSMCFYTIPYRLGIPWITYTDFPLPWDMRVPWLPSFIPHQFSKFTQDMSFPQRLRNTMLHIYLHLNGPKMEDYEDEMTLLKLPRTYGEFGSLDELLRRSKLFLITSDIVLDYPKPLMPTVVEVGGLTIQEPKQLPDKLKRFMDEAELGVVVVSFGSMMSQYSTEFVEKFVSALQHLQGYRVVWRIENIENVTLADNVLAVQWLPQIDVLAHPKTKLFITHCGNNGQFEAMYYKVPMIGFPFHADQHYNSKRIEYKGYGVAMNLYNFTSDQLLSNILTVLSNPSYRKRVARASDIFRSARERPAERAASWVEHICRFGGDHLRSAGSDLPLYQYLLLDVLALISLCTAVLIFAIYKILTFIIKKCVYFRQRKLNEKAKTE